MSFRRLLLNILWGLLGLLELLLRYLLLKLLLGHLLKLLLWYLLELLLWYLLLELWLCCKLLRITLLKLWLLSLGRALLILSWINSWWRSVLSMYQQ